MFEPIVGMLVFCGGAALAVKFIDWLLGGGAPRRVRVSPAGASASVCIPSRHPITGAYYHEERITTPEELIDARGNYLRSGNAAEDTDLTHEQVIAISHADVYFPNRYRPVVMDSKGPPEWAGGMGTEEDQQGIPVEIPAWWKVNR